MVDEVYDVSKVCERCIYGVRGVQVLYEAAIVYEV